MHENPQKLPNIQQAQQLAKKIQLLKQNVYPKKRRLTFKSNSVKILPSSKQVPKSDIKKIINVEGDYIQDEQSILQQKFTQNFLKKTNLEFHTKKFSSSEEVPPWTVQNWLPGSTLLKKKNIIQKQGENKPLIYYSRSELSQRKHHQTRDAQSLLRKNSLFLLNFLTKKQKKNGNSPHIGNFPLVFNKVERIGILEYKTQPLKTIQKKDPGQRQKIIKQRVQPWKQQKSLQRNRQFHSLHPQPW